MAKDKIGGKRKRISALGYYARNDAGDKQIFVAKTYGDYLKFKGSKDKEYPFVNKYGTTHIIVAENYTEALRIAKSLGFSADDYKKRKRRGK